MEQYFKANQKCWDEKTPIHLKSDFYDMTGFLSGKTSLRQPELDDLGREVNGKSMLHLQCHFGQDSMSFARLGARVTGVDFSDEAIKTACQINEQLALDVCFVQANIYDLPKTLSGQFDIIFTSYGTVTWLPDLAKWANVIYHFLAPGGIFYMVDFHPMLYMFDFDSNEIKYPYFNRGKPFMENIAGTYAAKESGLEGTEYFWCHSLHEIIQPLIQEGLQLVDFKEYDYSPYDCFPNMEKTGPQQYKYKGVNSRIAHLFSLKMKKE